MRSQWLLSTVALTKPSRLFVRNSQEDSGSLLLVFEYSNCLSHSCAAMSMMQVAS
jgi:hypothetical protein